MKAGGSFRPPSFGSGTHFVLVCAVGSGNESSLLSRLPAQHEFRLMNDSFPRGKDGQIKKQNGPGVAFADSGFYLLVGPGTVSINWPMRASTVLPSASAL